jgi:hypothetical protein
MRSCSYNRCLVGHSPYFSSTYNVIMTFNPNDLFTAEPKLLSLDCFPTLFTPLSPPDYHLIMAGNTRYHRLPEDSRLSMESETGNAEHDATLLLLEPSDDGNSSPKKESKFTFHPTMIFRLITICLLIPSFVLFILSHRPRSTSAIVFVTLAIVRNILVILHHVISRHIRFKIEFRNGSSRFPRPRRSCPTWMKQGPLHLLLDLVHVVLLLITSIIATQGSYGWYRSSRLTVPACILAHIGK